MSITTSYSTQQGIDRSRYPFGSNHAGVLESVCRSCGRTFDVGYERLIHPTFDPHCHDCHQMEARP